MEMTEMVERLAAAAAALEAAAEKLAARQNEMSVDAEATLGRIVATVESREVELERKLAEAEERLAELQGSAEMRGAGRRTLPANGSSLLAKQGVVAEQMEAGQLDAALAGLSVEQRFAVKAGLLRAGLV